MTYSTKTKMPRGTTRRRFLATAAAGAGLAVTGPLILTPGKAKAAESVVYVGWGGTTQATQDKVFCQTFTKETGIPVTQASGPDMAKIKAMVTTGNVEWDLVTITGNMAENMEREGLLEPIPSWVYDPTDLANPDWVTPGAIAWYYYTGGLAYDPKRHPDGKHPRTWKEFWDAERFPGRRGLRPRAEENFEIALIADGVDPKDIYPIDIDRAFKAMDRIKPHVNVWIKATPQTITMIQANEVDFDFAYTARVADAKAAGTSIDLSTEEPISTPGYLCVPKGAKNKEAAFKLLSHWMKPKPQAQWAIEKAGYAPQSLRAFDMLPKELLAKLHTPDNPRGVFSDVKWWGQNYTEVQKRFKEWMLT